VGNRRPADVEETMAKIRHLAIKTKNPERLATFYEEVFGLRRIRGEKGARST
jgi:predicted enzyme related to lactoylglutathione lyase